MALKAVYLYAAVVALLLCSSANFIQSPSDVFGPVALLEPTPSAARDFGAVVSEAPAAVMRPGSAADIARLLGALSSAAPGAPAVAARGTGHSLHGQAQARGGIVVETRALPRAVEVVARRGDGDGGAYADVGAGALWVEVLEECLRAGLAPRSWTDYLHLTVGGTLSNGGISGQAFKHGPQISNVLELEVVTGTPRPYARPRRARACSFCKFPSLPFVWWKKKTKKKARIRVISELCFFPFVLELFVPPFGCRHRRGGDMLTHPEPGAFLRRPWWPRPGRYHNQG